MQDNSAVALFLALGIIVAAARLAGSIARRLDQPRVLGELIVGVLLGPSLLSILNSSALGLQQADLQRTISQLAELGVLLLMFKVGLEVHVEQMLKAGRLALMAAALGATLSVTLTFLIASLFGYAWQPALFAGVTLAATSVSISAQVLLELGFLRTKEGNALLASALIDDGIALLLVSITVAITAPHGDVEAGTLVLIILRMALYILIAFVLAWFALPRLMDWVHNRPEIAHSYGVPASALICVFLFGWSAEVFGGIAAITGAFIAGIGLSRAHPAVRHQVDEAVSSIAYAFLVPIFFVSVGLNTDLSHFPLSALPLAGLFLLAAVAAKIIGCGGGARLAGFSNREALRLGVCMISRGEVSLIVASLGLSSGVFSSGEPLFTALFLVVLLTAVLTPPFVRRAFA